MLLSLMLLSLMLLSSFFLVLYIYILIRRTCPLFLRVSYHNAFYRDTDVKSGSVY